MRTHKPLVRWLAPMLGVLLVPLAAVASAPAPTPAPRAAAQATFVPADLWSRDLRIVASRAQRRPDPVFVAPNGDRITVDRIHRFLIRRGSPMAPYAREIVAAGVAYRVDPRVVVAIAGAESSFGVYRRGFNAWGWDIAHVRFRSWNDAILRYTAMLSMRYRSMRYGNFASGAAVYDPPDPSSWTRRCTEYFRSV